MRLSQEFSGEIIAADSRTVYKGLDIGTAKPSHKDQQLVKHHLLDIVQPEQEFNVADFKHQTMLAMRDIKDRGNLPIIVGGSGMYVNSVVYNYSFAGVGKNQGLRQELDDMTVHELQLRVKAAGLQLPTNHKNRRYLTRLLETNGKSVSQHQLPRGTLLVGINPPKAILEARIRQRLDAMLADGILDEAKHVLGQYAHNSEPLKGNIYRSLKPYFSNRISLGEALENFVRRDLKLAKKQITWFKRDINIVWFTDIETAYDYLSRQLD